MTRVSCASGGSDPGARGAARGSEVTKNAHENAKGSPLVVSLMIVNLQQCREPPPKLLFSPLTKRGLVGINFTSLDCFAVLACFILGTTLPLLLARGPLDPEVLIIRWRLPPWRESAI